MQALIDFDGWRKWKDFSQATPALADNGKKTAGSGGAKNGVYKSPKANLNSKVTGPVRFEKEKVSSLGLGKENGSDHTGTGNDTTDSGTGDEIVGAGA